jgi:hypothetical protein
MRAALLVATAVGIVGCASNPQSPPARPAQIVNATILVNSCGELGKTSARLAESAMYQLVEGCTSVPGGSVQFSATLVPGGRVDIQAADAGASDVIPMCILKHPLVHKVPLTKPCNLDVKIEQGTVNLPPS